MEVVVGRIGRPHGLRGEVTVAGHHRRPGRPVRRRCRAGHRPGRPGPVDRHRHAPVRARSWCSASTGVDRSRRRRGAARHDADPGRLDAARCRTIPTSSTTTSWSGWPCVDGAGTVLGRGGRGLASAGRPGAGGEPAGRLRGTGAVRLGDRAGRRPGRRAGWWSTRRTACSPERSMRISVVTIFPGYLDPLRESLLGKAIADGVDRSSPCTTCATGPPTGTAPSTTRRTAAGPGMVMKPDVWGRALDDGGGPGRAAPDAGRARPRPVGGSPRRRRARAGRAPSTWSSPAAGTRASTSG